MVSGLARCSFGLRPACSLTRFRAFCTKGFEHFIASMLASAATGWSVSCRVGLMLSHWSSAPFHGALKHALSDVKNTRPWLKERSVTGFEHHLVDSSGLNPVFRGCEIHFGGALGSPHKSEIRSETNPKN